MGNKQRRTLKALLQSQSPSNLLWADIESVITALGAKLREGSGSRVGVALNDVHWVFHGPHNGKFGKGRASDVRMFLQNAGVKEDDL